MKVWMYEGGTSADKPNSLSKSSNFSQKKPTKKEKNADIFFYVSALKK